MFAHEGARRLTGGCGGGAAPAGAGAAAGGGAVMQEAAASALGAWRDFYVIAGTAAATLTGLTFVALTLVAGARRTAGSSGGIGAFSTPTVVHFGAALLVAALLSAPWRALWHS